MECGSAWADEMARRVRAYEGAKSATVTWSGGAASIGQTLSGRNSAALGTGALRSSRWPRGFPRLREAGVANCHVGSRPFDHAGARAPPQSEGFYSSGL